MFRAAIVLCVCLALSQAIYVSHFHNSRQCSVQTEGEFVSLFAATIGSCTLSPGGNSYYMVKSESGSFSLMIGCNSTCMACAFSATSVSIGQCAMDVNHPTDSALISTGECYGFTPEQPVSNSISVVYTEDDNCSTVSHSLVITAGDPSGNCTELLGLTTDNYYSIEYDTENETYQVNLFCNSLCESCEVTATSLELKSCFEGNTSSIYLDSTDNIETCFASTTTQPVTTTTTTTPLQFVSLNHYQDARVQNTECDLSKAGQFHYQTEVAVGVCQVGYDGSFFLLNFVNNNDDDADDDDDNTDSDFLLNLECNAGCFDCNTSLPLDLDACAKFDQTSYLIKDTACLGGINGNDGVAEGSISVVRYNASVDCSPENSTATITYNFGSTTNCQPMDENSFGSASVVDGTANLNLYCDETCTTCQFQVPNMPIECYTAENLGADFAVFNTSKLSSCGVPSNNALSTAAIAAIAAGAAAGVILVVAFGCYIAKYKKRSDYTPLDD